MTTRNQFSYDQFVNWDWERLKDWQYYPVDELFNRPKAFKAKTTSLEFKPQKIIMDFECPECQSKTEYSSESILKMMNQLQQLYVLHVILCTIMTLLIAHEQQNHYQI